MKPGLKEIHSAMVYITNEKMNRNNSACFFSSFFLSLSLFNTSIWLNIIAVVLVIAKLFCFPPSWTLFRSVYGLFLYLFFLYVTCHLTFENEIIFITLSNCDSVFFDLTTILQHGLTLYVYFTHIKSPTFLISVNLKVKASDRNVWRNFSYHF